MVRLWRELILFHDIFEVLLKERVASLLRFVLEQNTGADLRFWCLELRELGVALLVTALCGGDVIIKLVDARGPVLEIRDGNHPRDLILFLAILFLCGQIFVGVGWCVRGVRGGGRHRGRVRALLNAQLALADLVLVGALLVGVDFFHKL